MGAIPITGPQTDRARIAPVPAWVVHEPYDAPGQPEEVFVSGGRCALLDDTQIDLTGPTRHWHSRHAERVITNAGAERAAQFTATFDPSCETLEVHYVQVRRGNQVIEHARPEAFEVFRRERSLERLVFDGRLTVHLVVPDVRPGDIVESAHTISGVNPILKDKHAAWISFEWGQAMLETRHRLLTRAERPIAIRNFHHAPQVETIEADGVVDRRWRAVRRPAVEHEDLAPPWLLGRAEIQFSEFADWREVSDLFTPLYIHDAALPDEVEEAIQLIAENFPSLADRAVMALRFVQTNLRYLALSIGEGGLQPRPIETAWVSRYGDCKDAARLYVAMARKLGIDCCPALVNTRTGEGLDQWLPTAAAFDHCIVRATIDGKAYWLDPTRRNQAGSLERLYRPYYGWALPLAEGVDSLSWMGPIPPEQMVDVHEQISFGPNPSSPARFEWRTAYASWRADDLRERIANEGVVTISRNFLRQLQETWPGATQVEPMVVEDDLEQNVLTTIETYEVASPWRRVERNRVEFAAKDFYVAADLVDLPPGPRASDIHLGRPRRSTRRIEIELPGAWRTEGWTQQAEAPGIRYSSKYTRLGRRKVLLEQDLEISADTLPAATADQYRAVIAVLRRSADIVLSRHVRGDSFVARDFGRWEIARTALLVAAVVVVAAFTGYMLQR